MPQLFGLLRNAHCCCQHEVQCRWLRLGYNTSAAAPSHPDSCIRSTNFSFGYRHRRSGQHRTTDSSIASHSFINSHKINIICSFLIDLPDLPHCDFHKYNNLSDYSALSPAFVYRPHNRQSIVTSLSFTFNIPTFFLQPGLSANKPQSSLIPPKDSVCRSILT